MKININFQKFKKITLKKNTKFYLDQESCKTTRYKVENLFNFLLAEKNSFIFESVEKGTIKGSLYNNWIKS